MQVATVLLASAPTVPGICTAGPLQQALVTQSIWAGLSSSGKHKGGSGGTGAEVEMEEEQPGGQFDIARVGQNHTFIGIYGVHTVFSAGKSPYVRSYTM